MSQEQVKEPKNWRKIAGWLRELNFEYAIPEFLIRLNCRQKDVVLLT